MRFKSYELRWMESKLYDYEIVKWDKKRTSCITVCFLKWNPQAGCHDVINVGTRPFEFCGKTQGLAGWIMKVVECVNYVRWLDDEDDFED